MASGAPTCVFFERFQDDFPNAQVVRLKRNYRSQPHIVTLSGQLMAQSASQPTPVAASGVEVHQIILHEAASEAAEAEFVGPYRRATSSAAILFSPSTAGRAAEVATDHLSFSDIAVLYRTEAQAPGARRGAATLRHAVPAPLATVRSSTIPASPHSSMPCWSNRLPARCASNSRPPSRRTGATGRVAWKRSTSWQPLATACGNDVERFLAELALGTQVDTWDPRADRMSLLTLHAAKGSGISGRLHRRVRRRPAAACVGTAQRGRPR